jgi:uncharacterized membrane protein
MKAIYCLCCIAVILLLSGVTAASGIATVHGVAYEWSTFEPLDNAIVKVNSTPAQSMVAKYGVYSFELSKGTYHIAASYYQNDQLAYYADDIITVSEEGTYVLDLLLLPSYSDDIPVSSISDPEYKIVSPVTNGGSLLIAPMLVVIVLLTLLVYQLKQKPQKGPLSKAAKARKHSGHIPVVAEDYEEAENISEEPFGPVADVNAQEHKAEISSGQEAEPSGITIQEPEKEPVISSALSTVISNEPVPADLQEILDILTSQGGRMTQKDMRKRLRYSEGKVSLMLLDLEKRGKIRKFKKGRGNVLFLVGSEE